MLINNIIEFVNKFLPNHLWISKGGLLHHIETYKTFPLNMPSAMSAIGYVTYPNDDCMIKGDRFFIILYKGKNRTFYNFLQTIGGKAEEYKENIILLTGENPWKCL